MNPFHQIVNNPNSQYEMRCAIWCHFYNLKNMKTPMDECYF